MIQLIHAQLECPQPPRRNWRSISSQHYHLSQGQERRQTSIRHHGRGPFGRSERCPLSVLAKARVHSPCCQPTPTATKTKRSNRPWFWLRGRPHSRWVPAKRWTSVKLQTSYIHHQSAARVPCPSQVVLYSGTRLIWTPRGHTTVSILSGCPSWRFLWEPA